MTDGGRTGADPRARPSKGRLRRSLPAILTFVAIVLLVYFAALILTDQGRSVPPGTLVDTPHPVGVYIGSIYSTDT